MKNWFLWLIAGVFSMACGIVALFNPFAAERFAGGLFLVIGGFQIYTSWRADRSRSTIGSLIAGAVALAIGATLLYNSFDGMLSLTILIAILLFILGSAKIFTSLSRRGTKYFIPMLISGIISFGLAIELFSNGLFLVVLALNSKRVSSKA